MWVRRSYWFPRDGTRQEVRLEEGKGVTRMKKNVRRQRANVVAIARGEKGLYGFEGLKE